MYVCLYVSLLAGVSVVSCYCSHFAGLWKLLPTSEVAETVMGWKTEQPHLKNTQTKKLVCARKTKMLKMNVCVSCP